ncbi:MAG: cysteine peptidase family C39 domain-containing protein [Firmicutes bacterium]|nr:cysteine peptidase family C39 domain-containing protein [Bacillota bacterium]
MQFVNLNWFLALAVALILFIACTILYKRFKGNKAILWFLAIIMFAVLLLFPLTYFSKALSQIPIYCSFRAMPYSEILVSFCAPIIALISVSLSKIMHQKIFKIYSQWVMCFLCLAFVSIPYIKPAILPLNPAMFRDEYIDGVCMQSTSSTCGPACLVTVFDQFGKKDTELSIAKHVFSCSRGTENWYLARYAQQQGLRYKFSFLENISEVKTPAIIGVGLGRNGHFITVLKSENGLYTVGDPLVGLEKLTATELLQKYSFTGFTLSFINAAHK